MKKNKMFNSTLLALFCLSLESVCAADYDMGDVNAKAAASVNKMPNVPKHLRMSDDKTEAMKSAEFQTLRAKCSTDWNQIVENFEKVNGGDEVKKFVIYGLENLSAQDYMTALEKLVTKYEAGALSEGIVGSLFRPHGRMGAFVIDNFDHARIIAFLNRIKSKTKNADLKADIDGILSGTAKNALDNYRADFEGMPEGNIPKIILPQ